MAAPDKKPVTMEELLVSSLAQTDALAKLLIEKRLITREEFIQKISEERAQGGGFGYHAEARDVETLWRHRHSSRYSSMHFSPVPVLLTWASFIKREAPARLKIRSFPVPRWY